MTAVWAPNASRLRLVHNGRITEMRQEDRGWWTTRCAIEHDDDYAFLVDGDDTPLPDPRSRFQPGGVHGASRGFDPDRFAWSDADWPGRELAGSVIYEVHLGTFTAGGTLEAAIDRLDHLVQLGVDLVELLPVNAFDGRHNWGYDGVLWYAVDDSYGGPLAYQRFVDECHQRGLGVVQDVVYNHLGPSGNSLPRFGPYLHPERTNSWGPAVNLDEPEVRRYILDNATMWFRDFHVDALRLDAVHALIDTGPTHVLAELASEVDELSKELGRPLWLIAESDLNDPIVTAPRAAGGFGLHAQWNDDFHHAVHVALTGESGGYYADFIDPTALEKVLTKGFFHDGTYSSFRGREHGRPLDLATTPTWRLVVSDQNHDQIGNRAAGDRLSATLDWQRLAIAAVLTLTSPFTPLLFMGEEWGASTPWQFFTSHPEPALAEATTAGRLEEFSRMGWDRDEVPDPQGPSTFGNSKLDWSEAERPGHAWLLRHYRALIQLRRANTDLTDPRFTATACCRDEQRRSFTIRRGRITVVVNLEPETLERPATGSLLFAIDEATSVSCGTLMLAPNSAAVLGDRP